MMRIRETIFTFLAILGAHHLGAQDSLSALREQTSPVVRLRDESYLMPGLRHWQRENNFAQLNAGYEQKKQDLYMEQEGSGFQRLSVYSEAYTKKQQGLTLWGHAFYNNVDRYKVRFNETADYATVYPYVMADTVGGDLKEEVYAFSGGLAKPFGRFHLGLNAGFNGKQTYRDRDPRIKSISSDITLSLSAARELGKYLLGISLDGRKYNQENGLEFVSELGSPLVYHDAGLGVYSDLLAGTRTDARFGGFGYGVTLQLSPLRYKGWTAHTAFRGQNINKELGTIRDYVGEIREKTLEGGIGYLYLQGRQHFIARANVSRVKRQGTEAKFNNQDAQVGIIKISEDIRYSNAYTKFNLRAVYGQTGGFADWFIGINGAYGDHLEQYADPDRMQSYTYINAGLDLTGRKQLGKVQLMANIALSRQQNLDAVSDWDNMTTASAQYGMLERNFAYLSVSGTGFNGLLRADFPLNQNIAGFIQAGAGYDNGPAKRGYQAVLGLRF